MEFIIRPVISWFYHSSIATRYIMGLLGLSVLYFVLWHGFVYLDSCYNEPLIDYVGDGMVHKLTEALFFFLLAFVSMSANLYASKRGINRLVGQDFRDARLDKFEETIDQLTQELETKEKELRSSQAERLAMLGAIPDLLFHIDRYGKMLAWAGPEKELYTEPEEIIGHYLKDYLPESLAELGLRRVTRVLEEQQLNIFEYTMPIQGSPNTFEARMIPMTKDSVLMVARNVTFVRETERAHLHQANMIRQMSDNIPEMFWSKDVNGKFVFVNKLYRETLLGGISSEDAKGLSVDQIVSGPFAEGIKDTDELVKQRKAPRRFIIKHVKEDGSDIWLDIYKSPWWSINLPHRIIGTVGSARDITGCMPTISKERLKDMNVVEVGFDQCFHWGPDDPAINLCMNCDVQPGSKILEDKE
jgi:PAS domain S-box-containing protein